MKFKIIFFLLIFLILPLKKVNAEIKDGLFMTIGDKAITQSDVVNEIKIFLILNNESYSDEKRDELQKIAVNSIIKRNSRLIAGKGISNVSKACLRFHRRHIHPKP